jgi:hypothetical protein
LTTGNFRRSLVANLTYFHPLEGTHGSSYGSLASHCAFRPNCLYCEFDLHAALTYHRNDSKQIPEEDKILAALRAAGLQRGYYHFPYATHKEMKSPAMMEKYKQGPAGMMTVFPSGAPAMGKFLGLWFGFCLIISFFVGYLAGHTIAPGADYLAVFRVVGTAAFLPYGLGQLSNGIWKGQPWGMTIKEAIDGLIYGLLTAGMFGWLWPR